MLHTRRAGTLTDLIVVVVILAVVVIVLLPALGRPRQGASRLMASQSNLKQLAIGSANFAAGNKDLLPGYHGANLPEGAEPRDALHAAQLEQAEILRRATGRVDGEHAIEADEMHVPQSRYPHIPLIEEMTGQHPEPVAVSPLDERLLDFQERPLDYDNLPGGRVGKTFDRWSLRQTVNRWPFGSSYQSTVYAWTTDEPTEADTLPVRPGAHASSLDFDGGQAVSVRRYPEIEFPSSKAFYFEEFDYTAGEGTEALHVWDDDARVNVMFFDTSVRRITTTEANPGWDPAAPCDIDASARVRYRPIDTRYFPEATKNTRGAPYRWTRGGLRGIDVGGNEITTAAWCSD